MELNDHIMAVVGDWWCKVCLNTTVKKTLSGENSVRRKCGNDRDVYLNMHLIYSTRLDVFSAIMFSLCYLLSSREV